MTFSKPNKNTLSLDLTVLTKPTIGKDGYLSSFASTSTGTFGGVVTAAPVPEPATWAMMLVGFGGLGVAMRSRRRASATA